MTPDPLTQATQLLQTGKRSEAQALLAEYLKRNPKSEAGWLLLSAAIADPQQQIECLKRVLRINPENVPARMQLARLAPEAVPPAPASAPPASISPFVTPVVEERPAPKLPPVPPPPPAKPKAPPAKLAPTSAKPNWWLWGGVGGIGCLGLLLIAVFGFLILRGLTATPVAQVMTSTRAAPAATVTVTPEATLTPPEPTTGNAFPTLPPTWTPTLLPSETPIPSLTPTPSLTPMPTLRPPQPTALAQMERIQQEVSDLRGLPILTAVPRYVLTANRVRGKLEEIFYSFGSIAELQDEARVLSTLGLIKPTYDLINSALNGIADGLGGFYLPWANELYVIGNDFGGIEHFIFSHEYNHALTEHHFKISQLGVYPECLGDEQRCDAIRALVEGDATVLMGQWWQQYATPQDYQDIFNYRPPRQILPEQFPPPYAAPDSDFPYEQGRDFVQYFYDRGNWAEVNKLYANLPQSTEQILHPQKYINGEAPLVVAAPPLTDTLGSGWRLVNNNSLGEWQTFLVLGYGSDVAAQIDLQTAETAAAGWGGDQYQVYSNDALTETVLAAQWIWDTQNDADQFRRALITYQNERFRGAKLERTDGECWEVNNQTSCVFAKGKTTLWLLTPNQTLLNAILPLYPEVQ